MKHHAKTERSRRRIPRRAKVLDALKELPRREGILFPAAEGGRINMTTGARASGAGAQGRGRGATADVRHAAHLRDVEPRGRDEHIFTLSRRMGMSVQMIDAPYGHLARDAEEQDRGLLDAYDGAAEEGRGHVVGTTSGHGDGVSERKDEKTLRVAAVSEKAREDSNL